MIAALAKINERSLLAGILTVALVARVAAAVVLPDQTALLHDAVNYRASAASLAADWSMHDAYQMPLYPLLIALTGSWQTTVDIALSVATVWLVYALARELFEPLWVALLAAFGAACYPPLIFFSVVGLSETLFIAMMLAAFLCWYRRRFFAAAVFATLTILTRPIFDVAAPCLVVLFALVIHRLSLAQTALQLAIYAAIYCALMTPWWINNYNVYHRHVHLTAGFGTQLYAGNNPMNRSGGANQGVDFDLTPFAEISNLVDRDRAMRDAAVAYIVNNPIRFLELAGLKFVRMWRLWPANAGYANRMTVAVSVATFTPLLVLCLAGIFFARRGIVYLSPILLFALGYTAIIMVMAGTIRYRLPLEPFMLIFGATAVSRLLGDRISVTGATTNAPGAAYARVEV